MGPKRHSVKNETARNMLVLRLFSTKRNIPRGAEFFFVCELSDRANLKKTKKNSAPRKQPLQSLQKLPKAILGKHS